MPKLCVFVLSERRAQPAHNFPVPRGAPTCAAPWYSVPQRAALTHLRRTFRDAVGPYGAHTTARRRCRRLRAVGPLDDQRRHELRRRRLRRRQRAARALHPRSLMQPNTAFNLTELPSVACGLAYWPPLSEIAPFARPPPAATRGRHNHIQCISSIGSLRALTSRLLRCGGSRQRAARKPARTPAPHGPGRLLPRRAFPG